MTRTIFTAFWGFVCLLFTGLSSLAGEHHPAIPIVTNSVMTARADTNYQPLENQRLSTTNSHTFAGDTIRNTTPTLVLQTSADSLHTRMYRSTTGNTFKISNNVSQVGNIGKSVKLDSTSLQQISVSDAGLPSNLSSTAFSVSLWFKTSASSIGGLINWGPAAGLAFFIRVLANGEVQVWNAHFSINSTNSYNDGNWHHLVFINTSAGADTLYVDASVQATGVSGNFSLTGTANIGLSYSASVANYLKGSLDQLVIYNTVLTSAQVSGLYNAGVGTATLPVAANIIRRYEFEEGTGTTTADLSGNGYNGTLLNGVQWATGIAPIAGISSEADVITSSDGVINAEKGQHTFGDFNGGSIIQGKAIRFLQSNVYPLWSDDSGRISIDHTNTGTYPTLSNDFTVKGSTYFNGNVGIGTATPEEALSVNGNIRAKQLTIALTGWPDYVFDTAYHPQTLTQLSQYISNHKHLPGMVSAKEIADSGLNVGKNQAALLQKIEELTLYMIEQDKKQQQQDKKQAQQDLLISQQSKLLQQQQLLLQQMQEELNKWKQSKK